MSYQDAVNDAYKPSDSPGANDGIEVFKRVSFIEAFLCAAFGDPDDGQKKGLPVRYPRGMAEPDPAGRNFTWFVSNEQNRKLGLPGLRWNQDGLPYYPTR